MNKQKDISIQKAGSINHTNFVTVRNRDNKIIGCARYRNCHLYNLFIDQQYRSQGLGSLLLTEVESEMKKGGCTKCSLIAFPTEFDASAIETKNRLHQFYLKNGYDYTWGVLHLLPTLSCKMYKPLKNEG